LKDFLFLSQRREEEETIFFSRKEWDNDLSSKESTNFLQELEED